MQSIREIVDTLRLGLQRVPALPWCYGACIIEPRISKEWPIDAKTFARAVVNALPRLLDEIECKSTGVTVDRALLQRLVDVARSGVIAMEMECGACRGWDKLVAAGDNEAALVQLVQHILDGGVL